jgi:hypothetical protein
MARLEAARKIADMGEGRSAMLLKVPENKLQKDESDEVWYENKLYDVVKRAVIRDTQFVFLLRDEEEQDILNTGSNYFKNDENVFQNKNANLISVKKISFGVDYNYIAHLSEKIIADHFIHIPPTVKNKFYYASMSTDVPSPPPRQGIFC